MRSNRSIPGATVLPEIAYPDIGQAISRLVECFGFTLRLRIGDHRAQMNVGSGAVILVKAGAGRSTRSSVMVRVESVDRQYERAVRSGVKVLRTPADYPYGERQCSLEDFAGHLWHFSESIADVDPRDWGGVPGEL